MHILISVTLLGEMLRSISKLREERALILARISRLEASLDEQLLDRLLERAFSLRPNVERDGEGLTELEFTLVMCIELGLVDQRAVRPFILQFREYDLLGTGRLGRRHMEKAQRLKRMQQQQEGSVSVHQQKALAAARRAQPKDLASSARGAVDKVVNHKVVALSLRGGRSSTKLDVPMHSNLGGERLDLNA